MRGVSRRVSLNDYRAHIAFRTQSLSTHQPRRCLRSSAEPADPSPLPPRSIVASASHWPLLSVDESIHWVETNVAQHPFVTSFDASIQPRLWVVTKQSHCLLYLTARADRMPLASSSAPSLKRNPTRYTKKTVRRSSPLAYKKTVPLRNWRQPCP